ncbi:dipeptide epimerase [Aneurinibacillus thermoaerophilus]|uniref:dipeptide epimerase n=1 Tax=Aneurinibacillus thermoaerophilus TaxID=143495 RepID=UPI002E204B66|nr:dipeptide epimerase [Aneurinibacillus thermoaerophilus]
MIIRELYVKQRHLPLRVPFKTALRTAVDIESLEVMIELENGLTGIGAAVPTWVITGDSSESIKAALLGPIRSAIIDEDITNFKKVLKKVQKCCIGNTSAKAAADIALHDLYARLLQLPLYALLGGKGTIETDMTVGVDDPDVMAVNAEKSVKDGFKVLKIKVGNDPTLDIARIQAIRERIPATIKIRLDANQGWTPKEAVRLIREMENLELGIELVEQPVHARDLEGLKFVTDRVNTPIMADESLFSASDALMLVSGRYVDLLNIKLMKCGGIDEAIKLASIAEANGIACMIGSMMESSLSVAAAAHFAAGHPNIKFYDLDAPLWLVEEPEGMIYNGGNIQLVDVPGLGITREKEW